MGKTENARLMAFIYVSCTNCCLFLAGHIKGTGGPPVLLHRCLVYMSLIWHVGLWLTWDNLWNIVLTVVTNANKMR